MTTPTTVKPIVYPDSDGQPMADNTKQFEELTALKQGCEAAFAEQENVFVAGDLLWYPVEGQPATHLAPDVLVVFGRPRDIEGAISNGTRKISHRKWSLRSSPPEIASVRCSAN